MGKKLSLSQVHRAKIVTLYKEDHSKRQISAKCDVSKTAIHTVVVNWRLRRNYNDLNRSGRPNKTTVRDNHSMKKMVD